MVRSYSSRYKRPPSISRHTAVSHMSFSRARLNMLASTVVTAAWTLPTRYSIVPRETAQTCSFRCSHRKNSIAVRSSERGGRAIDPPSPVHLPGCVTFNHCRISSRQCEGAPSSWNLIARGISSSSSGRTVSRNYDIVEQSACQVADNVSHDTTSNAEAEAGFLNMFADSMRSIQRWLLGT
jgi:hypothetical protein